VAQGLLTLLVENAERITRQAGMPIEVVRIASRSAKPEVDVGMAVFDTNLDSLLHDDVDVVVELIGGVDAARELISSALARGKSIVTANKAVLAAHLKSAREPHPHRRLTRQQHQHHRVRANPSWYQIPPFRRPLRASQNGLRCEPPRSAYPLVE
jgi:homoserine dehydrogenase